MHLCHDLLGELYSCRPNLEREWISPQSLVPWGRLESFAHHYEGACHPAGEAHTTRSSGEGRALDVDRHNRIGDHNAHGSRTDYAGPRVPHASRAILVYGLTRLYLQRWICCGSYSVTAIQLNFDLLLPGVDL